MINFDVEKHMDETERKLRKLLRPDNREDQAYISGYMGGMRNILQKMIEND